MRQCQECGKEITKHFRPSDLKRGKGRLCSLACNARKVSRIRKSQRGTRNPNWKGGTSPDSALKMRKYRTTYPEKELAHSLTTRSIANGTLKRLSCARCGVKKVHAHHEDYSKPLEIIWLCQKHHIERHREIKNDLR